MSKKGCPPALDTLVLVVSRAPKNHAKLEEDLKRIGCHELLTKSWNLKGENMVQELIVGVPNQYDLIMRAKPKKWTANRWRET